MNREKLQLEEKINLLSMDLANLLNSYYKGNEDRAVQYAVVVAVRSCFAVSPNLVQAFGFFEFCKLDLMANQDIFKKGDRVLTFEKFGGCDLIV